MEFSKEFIEENKLDDNQVKAITDLTVTHIQDLKGDWDGKANKDAEAILDGAAKKIQEVTGVQRDQGEKIADYIGKSWTTFSETKTQELDTKISEYDTKIKGVKGNEALTKEYDELKGKFSSLQQKEADFDTLLNSGVKDKYETLLSESSSLKIGNAFNSVKPNFPDTVNSYEALAKWDKFKKEILNSNTLEQVDGEWIAVNKENKHKTTKLSDLVSKDADLTKLMEGRQQKGSGSKEATLLKIEGVPFDVPENATSIERSKLIKDHLSSKGIGTTHPDYTKKFAELNSKMLNTVTA